MRVIMIIAQKDFRDEELFDTKDALVQQNIGIDVAAPSTGTAFGKLGGTIEPDLSFDEVELERYDGIVFVGGPGAYDLIDDTSLHALANNFYNDDKVVAAICIAPAILARADLLGGKSATIHSSGENYLKEAEADYTEEDIEQDGKLITANGPAVASLFGQTIAKELRS
jgi:protease I